MGPNLLLWKSSENLGEWGGRQASSTWRRLRRGGQWLIALPLALAPLLALILGSQARHWLVEAFTTICVVGGILAAPILSLAAWVGMFLPEHVPLHRLSTVLFAISLVWLGAALVGAHIHRGTIEAAETTGE